MNLRVGLATGITTQLRTRAVQEAQPRYPGTVVHKHVPVQPSAEDLVGRHVVQQRHHLRVGERRRLVAC